MNVNEQQNIIKILSSMAFFYSILGDPYRERAYSNAVSDITNGDIDELTAKMKAKVDEIITTGKLKKHSELIKDPMIRDISSLQNVYGIGPKLAIKLYKKGHKSPRDLQKIIHTLPAHIQLGLEYHDDLQQPIKIATVKSFEEEVRNAASNLVESVILCGSARRGKIPRDIDMLIVSNDDSNVNSNLLDNIIDIVSKNGKFKKIGVLASGKTKLMGLIEGPDHVFKTDIRLVPFKSKATAMMYFTGSKLFNIRMRQLAIRKGLILNEYGLFKGVEQLPTADEKSIFDNLGIDYIDPKNR